MPTFKVCVRRTEITICEVEIEADNEQLAKVMAEGNAVDGEYTDETEDYEIEWVTYEAFIPDEDGLKI